VEKLSTSRTKTTTTSMGGICWFVRFSPLSHLEKVGSRFGSSGVFCLASGPYNPLAPPVPVGDRGRPPYFLWASGAWGTTGGRCFSPDLPRPRSSQIWAPSTALTLRRASVDCPRSGGFQDQARMCLFVSLFGAFWASGTCGFCDGVPRAAAVFPWSVHDPGIRLFC
jgi:hypothetical protein